VNTACSNMASFAIAMTMIFIHWVALVVARAVMEVDRYVITLQCAQTT
jgi:hypothetical protein